MGTGYVRNDTTNKITDGGVIDAADLDGEFDAVQAAFVNTSGHSHDGTVAEGGAVLVLGPAQDFVADASALFPKTDSAYTFGKSGNALSNVFTDVLTLGGTAVTSTAAELNILDGVTSTSTELNLLDGVTATTSEINILDGVTSTAAELNLLDGVTATTAELNILDNVTATSDEINILDGVTATYAELNLMDGVTATTEELNTLDGVTSTATEINLLDGVTSTTAELNILDGVTATTAEINILDGVTSTAAELNILDGVTSTAAEINILDGVTATAAELNHLDGQDQGVATTDDVSFVDLTATGAFTSLGIDDNATSTAITIDSNERVGFGTTSPDTIIDIDTGSASQTALTIQANGVTSAKLQAGLGLFSSGFPAILGSANGFDIGTSSSAPVRVFTNSVERMRIDSSGNLLVGTTSNVPHATGTYGAAIRSGGKIFIGVDSSEAGIFARWGSDGSAIRLQKNNVTVGTISVTGSATAYNTSSDHRLKENVTSIQGASDIVMSMRPVTAEFISDGVWYDCFLAHELQEVLPQAVTGTKDAMMDEEYEVKAAVYKDVVVPATDDSKESTKSVLVTEAVVGTRSVPDMQSVDYSKLTPILTAALQEALTKITDLEKRLSALEA